VSDSEQPNLDISDPRRRKTFVLLQKKHRWMVPVAET